MIDLLIDQNINSASPIHICFDDYTYKKYSVEIRSKPYGGRRAARHAQRSLHLIHLAC